MTLPEKKHCMKNILFAFSQRKQQNKQNFSNIKEQFSTKRSRLKVLSNYLL